MFLIDPWEPIPGVFTIMGCTDRAPFLILGFFLGEPTLWSRLLSYDARATHSRPAAVPRCT